MIYFAFVILNAHTKTKENKNFRMLADIIYELHITDDGILLL